MALMRIDLLFLQFVCLFFALTSFSYLRVQNNSGLLDGLVPVSFVLLESTQWLFCIMPLMGQWEVVMKVSEILEC